MAKINLALCILFALFACENSFATVKNYQIPFSNLTEIDIRAQYHLDSAHWSLTCNVSNDALYNVTWQYHGQQYWSFLPVILKTRPSDVGKLADAQGEIHISYYWGQQPATVSCSYA